MRLRFVACAWVPVLLVTAAIAMAGPRKSADAARYTITDLGTLPGGAFSQATFVTDNQLITGISTGSDGTQHAVAWYRGRIVDLRQPLGGPNSGAFGANVFGLIAGQAETVDNDPNNENFCAYFTGLQCRPFAWGAGVVRPLPTLGGSNGTVGVPNRLGQIPGLAETSVADPTCPATPAVNGTGPQVLQFKPVIWERRPGRVRQLDLPAGDTVGMALWLNDKGQAVGTTGTCADTIVPPFAIGPHAVIWHSDGSVQDLGNLGGTANPGVLGIGNVAFAINDRSQVTGISALPDGVDAHAFRWTAATGMQDLGTLPGDNISVGLSINDAGDVVGASIAGPDPLTGMPKAVIWHAGAITDLNTVVPADTSLLLLTAFTINDAGQVVGFGVDLDTSELHAFLATPAYGRRRRPARGEVKGPDCLPPWISRQLRHAGWF